ncbi:MAG: archease [Desulfomonile sp.]|nr:archease [Desulfomonile sp.]
MDTLSRKDAGWKLLEHTADIRMEVWGATIEELFAHAADGLTSLLSTGPKQPAERVLDVGIEGGDPEQLLVNFLREILFLFQVNGFVVTGSEITFPDQTRLQAKLHGRYARSDEPQPEEEIKGVTYHDLSIRRNDGYSVRIVFDV